MICWKVYNLQAGHLVTRAKYSVRWDLDNVFTQCGGCNLAHEYNPHPFTEWYIDHFGLDRYKALIKKSNQSVKFYDSDLKIMLDRLTEIHQKYNSLSEAIDYEKTKIKKESEGSLKKRAKASDPIS